MAAVLTPEIFRLSANVRVFFTDPDDNSPGPPAAATDGSYQQGDVVICSTPATGQPWAWACVTSGSPGTWKVIATAA